MDFMTCPALSHTNVALYVLDTVDTDTEVTETDKNPTLWQLMAQGRETQEVVK